MSLPALPYSEPVRLHQVGAGVNRTLQPDETARARIANALDLASLDTFIADMVLTPSAGGWRLNGRVRATLAQTCGITLEPLPLEVDAPFTVNLAEAVPDPDSGEIVITLDDESPDVIENGQIDLGQYAVEQLALQLDPFPRKAGAEFVQPPEPEEISPFAVLKRLRPDDEG
ncbi:MAG TPA: DUF177 domain-containing protein [Brevundimonas sp.]|nr:DUF177 domain-containing protein [Brevundimonas sp.]